MMLKRWNHVGVPPIGPARGRRAVSILRAQATAQPQAGPQLQAQPQLTSQALAFHLAAAPPTSGRRLPLSYRTLTTDPVFRPAASSDQQYAPGAPQLLSRHLTVNPLHGLVAWAEAQTARLDLGLAAAVDRQPLLQGAAAAATAALTLLGLHPLSLLRSGVPEVAADWLEAVLGGWAVPLAGAAALAAGLAAAAWQLRTWVAAQLALVRFDQMLLRIAEAHQSDAAASTAAAAAAAAPPQVASVPTAPSPGPLAALIPPSLGLVFSERWKSTDRTWLLIILAARLGCLLVGASALLSLGTTTAGAALAAACFGASLLPLALPHVRQLLAAAAPPPGGAAALTAALALSDAAFLLVLAPAVPLAARAAAAAAMAAGTAAAAAAAAASGRLTPAQAAPGDVATFHVVVRLPGSGTLIDTTLGHRPLKAVVGDATAAAAAGSSSSGDAATPDRDPQARFRPLQAALAAAELPGMYLNERRTVVLGSATGGSAAAAAGDADADADADPLPFRNPGLVWWQPLDDLRRKVGSAERELRAGDVFWYPVGPLVAELAARRLSTAALASAGAGAGAAAVAALPGGDSWGPVEVVAVSEGWVQLDANAGLKGGQVDVEVWIEGLEKGAEGAEGTAGSKAG